MLQLHKSIGFLYYMKRLLVFLAIIVLCSGCFNEDDASVVAIMISPSASVVNSGEKMYIDLSIRTLNDRIESVEVSTFDSWYGMQTIHTADPGSATYKEKIIYIAPYIDTDSTEVEFTFKATDNTGAEGVFPYRLTVRNDSGNMLPEHSSIVLYSPLSGKDDAFSFTTLQPLASSDTTGVDMYIFIHPDSERMQFCIGTKTDMVFARSNNFDYASASWGGLSSVLMNSIRSRQVEDIAIDDVILVGQEEMNGTVLNITPVGVIKIMAVYDEEGSSSDRIILNLKTIRQ